jgi:hypothetical protein
LNVGKKDNRNLKKVLLFLNSKSIEENPRLEFENVKGTDILD